MRSFTDNKGDKWHIDITAGSLCDVYTELGYDLSESIDHIPDGIKGQVALIAVLCREQIDKRELTERDFAHRLAGDAFAAANLCILRELADFFCHHKPAYGEILRRTIDQDEKVSGLLIDLAKQACSNHFSSLEESRESTPGP